MTNLEELANRILDLPVDAKDWTTAGMRIEVAKIADEVLNLDLQVNSPVPAEAGLDSLGHLPWEPSQRGMIFGLLGTIGITDDDARHDLASQILGRNVKSFRGLTRSEASTLIEALTYIEVYVDGAAA